MKSVNEQLGNRHPLSLRRGDLDPLQLRRASTEAFLVQDGTIRTLKRKDDLGVAGQTSGRFLSDLLSPVISPVPLSDEPASHAKSACTTMLGRT